MSLCIELRSTQVPLRVSGRPALCVNSILVEVFGQWNQLMNGFIQESFWKMNYHLLTCLFIFSRVSLKQDRTA